MISPVAMQFPHRSRRRHGIALVLVLASLVLLSAIILAFFMTATSNRTSSSQFAYSVNSKILSDTAVNLVIAQVQAATTGTLTTSGTLPRPWASQPGMIRTFRFDGSLDYAYKLYSSGSMTTTTVSGSLDLPPSDWDTRPAAFTDLNEPAEISGTLQFPIVDPRAMDPANQTGPNSVEGFSYTQAINGVSLTSGSQRLPMPAQWLYILESGSLVSPGPNDKGTADFSPNPAISASNSVIGRIAFWTDDETCKVNVNTASEAIPWDIPRCYTPDDRDYAAHLPAKHEVQRYPGHPATTCLSSVLFPNQYLDLDPTGNKAKYNAIYDLVPKVSGSGGYLDNYNSSPITYDSDRLYASYDEILFAPSRSPNALFNLISPDTLNKCRFFLTANSRAPEINQLGMPRICLWPVSVPGSNASGQPLQTGLDKTIAFCTTLNNQRYYFQRNWKNLQAGASNLNLKAEYTSNTRNFSLYTYLSNLAHLPTPGYGGTFASKYLQNDNATGLTPPMVSNIDFDLFNMVDFIRTTNLMDNTKVGSNRVAPYAYSSNANSDLGYGEAEGILASLSTTLTGATYNSSAPIQLKNTPLADLIDPNLSSSTIGTYRSWRTFGRYYSVSEVAIVFSCPAEWRITPAPGGTKIGPIDYFDDGTPAMSGRLKIGEKAIEVGLLGEGFSPTQGYVMTYPDVALSTNYYTGSATSHMITLQKPAGGNYPLYIWNPKDHQVNYVSASGTKPASGITSAWSEQIGCTYDTDATSGKAPGSWACGWGGSGGPHMFTCTSSTNFVTTSGTTEPERPRMINGFFKVSASDNSLSINAFRYLLRIRQQPRQSTTAMGTGVDNYYLDGPAMTTPMPSPTSFVWSGTGGLWNQMQKSGSSSDVTTLLTRSILGDNTLSNATNVVRSFVVKDSDYRLSSLWRGSAVGSDATGRPFFVAHPLNSNSQTRIAHSLTDNGGQALPGATFALTGSSSGSARTLFDKSGNYSYPAAVAADFPAAPPKTIPNYPFSADPADTRDWDNGTGIAPDGAYVNKPDDGGYGSKPYFKQEYDSPRDRTTSNQEMLSPNRLIPSAIQFGSLPSAPLGQIPWTTFLFRPDLTPPLGATSGTGGHLGSAGHSVSSTSTSTAPPDHALLDWFWLPVVEPYAISEPFSTAGKINMNYQIMPYSYIKRATGLWAVLKSEKLLAIPDDGIQTYKTGPDGSWRHHIDANSTLAQFDDLFSKGQIFQSESKICEQFLVPKDDVTISGTTASAIRSAMVTYWNTHRLSGDNTLERPYANIYPRLTTRSNTFTVHYRVQVLKKPSRNNPKVFMDPASTAGGLKDSVVSEYRGSTTFERYIDPKDPNITVDYLTNPVTTDTLDKHYKFRILNTKQFTP